MGIVVADEIHTGPRKGEEFDEAFAAGDLDLERARRCCWRVGGRPKELPFGAIAHEARGMGPLQSAPGAPNRRTPGRYERG